MEANRVIRQRMNIKPYDTLPFKGWRHTVTRKDLYQIFAELEYTNGAEIGVASGRNARDMFRAIPGLHLYLVDSYTEYFRYSQALCDKRKKGMLRLLENRHKTLLEMTSLEVPRRQTASLAQRFQTTGGARIV